MTKSILTKLIVAFTVLLCIGSSAYSQKDVIKVRPCLTAEIHHQVDSVKAIYEREGFIVMKEASIAMESEYEMPVITPLQQGSWYQIVFIGDMSSKLYEVRMYDYNEKMVVYKKKLWGDVDGNVIDFRYVPQFTEFHMIKPVQVNKRKKKDLCGYVMLMKKTK